MLLESAIAIYGIIPEIVTQGTISSVSFTTIKRMTNENTQSVIIRMGRVIIRSIVPRIKLTRERITTKTSALSYHFSRVIPGKFCEIRRMTSPVRRNWKMYFIWLLYFRIKYLQKFFECDTIKPYLIFFFMWLFDNIFLDKDTPTALLDNPEIKAPDGAAKKEEEKAPYDPKNDPIAPPIDSMAEWELWWTEWTNEAEVSFDIWGDLDFSAIGTAEPEEMKTIEPEEVWIREEKNEEKNDTFSVDVGWETIKTETASISDSWISSIAMIQWGTASIVDGIDIWGADGSSSDQWVSIEIHDIEDHHTDNVSENGNWAGGIYGFMDKSIPDWSEAPVWETPEIAIESPVKEEITIDPLPVIEPSVESSISILDTDNTVEYPVRSHKGGKIQELIGKLIAELHALDEEDQKAEDERQSKIENITKRERELEHEYTTRKEALKYERTSLELPADRSVEKERIKSLISSFQEDLG
jgi:hypothetical protein